MKKIKLGIFTILLLTGVFVIIFSCKKEAGLTNDQTFNYSASEYIPNSEDVISLILKFKEAHSNYENGLKTFSDMPVDQALWTLEATANYDYASEKDSTADYVYDSVFVYIDSYINGDDELILEGESLMEAYDDLFDFIYDQITASPNTVLIVGDLSVVEATTPLTTFMLSTVTGLIIPGNYGINATDYWYAILELGQCGPYPGQNVGWDASNRINQVLNWNHGLAYACANGGTLFYTSIDEFEISIGQYGQWLFWYGQTNECLNPTEMSYWVGIAEDEIEASRPTGKVFIDVEFFDDYCPLSQEFVHRIDPVRYGIINCTDPHE